MQPPKPRLKRMDRQQIPGHQKRHHNYAELVLASQNHDCNQSFE